MGKNINDSIIKIDDLTKIYRSKGGRVKALDHIDLDVFKGDIFGFIGPNGAGKTTTIRILTGITSPTSGKARVAGFDVVKQPIEVKKRIGAVPEEISFYNNMTGRDILEYHAEFYGDGIYKDNLDSITKKTGISDHLDRKVGEYSFGMKKRLAVSQALITEPDILILDEPTLALDPKAAHFFIELIRDLNEEGLTIFLSSHILPVVQKLCTRVGIIDKGSILRVDGIEELSKDLSDGGVHVIIQGTGFDGTVLNEINNISDVSEVEKIRGGLLVRSSTVDDIIFRINSVLKKFDVDIRSIKLDYPDLEDIFLRIIGGDTDE